MSNGNKQLQDTEQYRPGMVKRVRQPLFEKDIISPGIGVEDAFTSTFFTDEESLNRACLYLAWLEMFGLEEEKRQALYKINGNKAIEYRAVKHGVMAHGELFWDSDASKEDKKYLSKIQARDKSDHNEGKGEENR